VHCARLVCNVVFWCALCSFGVHCAHLVFTVHAWCALCSVGVQCAHLVSTVLVWFCYHNVYSYKDLKENNFAIVTVDNKLFSLGSLL
jgi:hypothetical protein